MVNYLPFDATIRDASERGGGQRGASFRQEGWRCASLAGRVGKNGSDIPGAADHRRHHDDDQHPAAHRLAQDHDVGHQHQLEHWCRWQPSGWRSLTYVALISRLQAWSLISKTGFVHHLTVRKRQQPQYLVVRSGSVRSSNSVTSRLPAVEPRVCAYCGGGFARPGPDQPFECIAIAVSVGLREPAVRDARKAQETNAFH